MEEHARFRDLSEVRETLSPAELAFERRRRTAGLFIGPLLFLLLLLFPIDVPDPRAARLAAILAWVLTWWITEAVAIPVTALLGPALAVLCGVGGAKEMFASFGDPVIFLFLGSFVIAEAMSVHGLDRRIAYGILDRPWVGCSTHRILIAFTVIIAGLSMWFSNTATTAMMYPIAMGVLTALSRLLAHGDGPPADLQKMRFGTALLLICAYASSIGGIGTPVGTPPNLIALGQLAELTGTRIPFFQWMTLAVPIVVAMLAFAVLYFRFAFPPEVGTIAGSAEFVAGERGRLGAWTAGQRNILAAFILTAALWVLPGIAAIVLGADSPASRTLTSLLPEGVVALVGATLLFVLPVSWKERRFTVSWSDVARIDWGTLMLFGGGLALGGAMFRTGLADAVGHALTSVTGARSLVALTFLFSVFSIYFTEVTSNTATATMLVPLAIAAARAAGVSPIEPAVGCAIGCSMAFMLPVATPPNAIIYGSGCVPITKMVRAGFWFNIAASIIVPTGVLIMCRLLGL